MAYADLTVHDRNPLKRWLQKQRFSDAVAVLKKAGNMRDLRIFDFGAGDGELTRQIAALEPAEVWAYEPAASLLSEARQNLAGYKQVVITDRLDEPRAQAFDYVFCLEVFEHLPESETLAALADIGRLLKPAGKAVIGVPHELFLPALAKGIFRMSRRYGSFDAQPRNVLRASIGRPPRIRPVGEIGPGLNFHFHHLGFDYRAFERKLEEQFQIRRKWFSPIPLFGALLNSEVYFLLTKR